MAGSWRDRVSAPLARTYRWLLLDGDRLTVTAVMLVVLFVLIGPVGHSLLDLTGSGLSDRRSVAQLLSTLLSGVFLLVSIVVSINSLYVSREQVPLGEQFDRVRNAVEFRRELEDLVDVPISPAEPDRFLQVLTSELVSKAQTLNDQLSHADADLEADAQEYVAHAAEQTEELNASLQSASSPLSLVLATMDYDETELTVGLRRIRSERDRIPDDADATIEELLQIIDHLTAASEYFKTLYFGREFAELSNRLLVVAVPAIGIVSFALSHVNRLPDSRLLVALIHVIALAPVALLATYVVRVATVSKRTRSTGQFLVGSPEDVPWDRPGGED
jgi:hypothetical protein